MAKDALEALTNMRDFMRLEGLDVPIEADVKYALIKEFGPGVGKRKDVHLTLAAMVGEAITMGKLTREEAIEALDGGLEWLNQRRK